MLKARGPAALSGTYDRAPWDGGESCRPSTTPGVHLLYCQYGVMACGGLATEETSAQEYLSLPNDIFPLSPRERALSLIAEEAPEHALAPCRPLVTGPAVGLRIGDVRTRIAAV